MPIIYTVVAQGPIVLAEHTTCTGNFAQIAKSILDKLPEYDSKMSYLYDRYIFHYVVQNGIIYLCMADEAVPRGLAFAYLEEIRGRFEAVCILPLTTTAHHQHQREFEPVLVAQMDYYSYNQNADRLSQVKGDLDEVKKVMVENIEKVLQRGEHIELLVDKTENLSQQGLQFKKKTINLQRRLWWRNKKMAVVVALVVLVAAYVVLAALCGGPRLPCILPSQQE